MHTRAALLRIAISCSLVLNALPAWSRGGRDATFGTLGEVHLSPGVAISTAIQQPDGKVLLAGYTSVAGTSIDLVVVRLLESGSLDTGFGTGRHSADRHRRGKRSCHGDGPAIGRPDCQLPGAPRPNSMWVAASAAWSGSTAMAPLTSRSASTAAPSIPRRVVLHLMPLPYRRMTAIVAIGSLNNAVGDFVVTRLHANGALDTSFGDQGVKVLDWAKGYDLPFDIAIQGDGRILVAGEVGENPCGSWDQKMAVLRLLGDGTARSVLRYRGMVDVRARLRRRSGRWPAAAIRWAHPGCGQCAQRYITMTTRSVIRSIG